MKTAEFDYHLPEDRIAYYPLPERVKSRLLVLDRASDQLQDQQFADIVDYLSPGDLLVLNNSKVLKARLYGHKRSGGKVEMLVERVIKPDTAWCHVKASHGLKEGTEVIIVDAGGLSAGMLKCTGREGDLFILTLVGHHHKSFYDLMADAGHIPLPPYIKREDDDSDMERYQTVYAQKLGSVAAPTAGLHFSEALLDKINTKGVNLAYVTLHVGAGTFQPVRVDDITQHKMHGEIIDVPESLCEQVKATQQAGHKVIAVGTTTVRSLETAAQSGELKPYQGETDIFIYPGFEFKVIDAMVTNFHLPESTLLMLVSAFAGKEAILNAYQHAIEHEYRFFSYGDAMLMI